MDTKFKVNVDNSYKYILEPSEIENLDILKLSKSKFHVLKNCKSFVVEVEKSNFNKKEYVVKINSTAYSIKISNSLDILIKELGFSLRTINKINNIKAPMPGLILNILAKEEQEVKEGETLLILEAMKMENTISAPKDGFIKTIFAKKGTSVEKGELIIEMK